MPIQIRAIVLVPDDNDITVVIALMIGLVLLFPINHPKAIISNQLAMEIVLAH